MKFPAPTSPHSTEEAPNTSKIGLALSKSVDVPPVMMANVPSIAPGSPPDTGASKNLTFLTSHCPDIF